MASPKKYERLLLHNGKAKAIGVAPSNVKINANSAKNQGRLLLPNCKAVRVAPSNIKINNKRAIRHGRLMLPGGRVTKPRHRAYRPQPRFFRRTGIVPYQKTPYQLWRQKLKSDPIEKKLAQIVRMSKMSRNINSAVEDSTEMVSTESGSTDAVMEDSETGRHDREDYGVELTEDHMEDTNALPEMDVDVEDENDMLMTIGPREEVLEDICQLFSNVGLGKENFLLGLAEDILR
ncbi:hypothetical protein GE09DRAFT_377232 [Coniochaeta sp. 2T2.1]|nr:hypothetical protein GE09DRAFT_377232 [Coniochaeta sp. 2T2.1]